MTDFNVDTALTILNVDADDAAFVINFDDAWQWIGYSTKGNAMRLLRENFTEGVDFVLIISDETLQDGTFSHYQHTVTLTKDCFKGFCLMARTAKGREVRNYFIEAEKRLRDLQRQVQLQADQVKELAPWSHERMIGASLHLQFQNACLAKKHPASHVHDLITRLITGQTARQARHQNPLVNGDPTIGLNYQPSPDQLRLINDAKLMYIRYKKGSWQDQARRAVFHASKD